MASNDIRNAIYATTIDGGAIAIAGVNSRTSLRLLGATMTCNVNPTPRFRHEKTIVLYPDRGEEGVIAVLIEEYDGYSGGKYNKMRVKYIPAFLKVSWEGDGDDVKPYIDLDVLWFTGHRVGWISGHDYDHAIEVTIKGKRFSSHKEGGDAEKETVYGLDGNLLCRYLWGTASAGDVLHEAVQTKVEPLAVERAAQLTRDVIELTCGIRERDDRIAELSASLAHAHNVVEDLLLQVSSTMTSMRGLRGLLQRIPRWLRPEAVSNFLAAMKSMEY